MSDVSEEEAGGDAKKSAAVSLLQDPNVMAALQGKLQGMLGKMSFSKRKNGGGKVKTPSDNPRWEVS